MSTEDSRHRFLAYLRGGRIHHALILASEDGAFSLVLAKSLAKHVLCVSAGKQLFCDKCTHCRRVEKEIHPDVIYLKDEEEDTIKVESVRTVCHHMQISPLEGGAKVCIVERCERMGTASANAFLKTLEEPGEGRYFILLTPQPGMLLPTILSRCMLFSQKTKVAVDPEETEKFSRLLEGFFKTKSVFELTRELSDKDRATRFVSFLQRGIRDAVVAPKTSNSLFARFSDYRCLDLYEGVIELESRSHSNANLGLLIEDYLRAAV